MNQEIKPKLSKFFGYGLLLMVFTGVLFIVRDQMDNKTIYNTFAIAGFVSGYTGFTICAATMFKYWIDIYNSLRKKK